MSFESAPDPAADAADLTGIIAGTAEAESGADAEDASEESSLLEQLSQYAEGKPADEEGGEPAARPAAPTPRSAARERPAAPEAEQAEPAPAANARWAELRTQNRELERRAAQYEQRLGQLIEALNQRFATEDEAEQEPPPSFATDPEGYIESALDRKVGPITERLDEDREALNQETIEELHRDVIDYVEEDRAAGIAKRPDYEEAERFAMAATFRQLMFNNPGATEEDIRAYIEETYVPSLHFHHAQSGTSLTDAVYDLALAHGYQPNGEQPAVATDERIEGIRAAMDAGQGVGAVPPSPQPKAPTPKDILALSDDDFADLMDDIKTGDMNKLLRAFGSASAV